MEDRMNGREWGSNTGWIISGVAIGTGIALAYAASRRKKSWQDRLIDTADSVASRREDLLDSGKNIVDRIRTIYVASPRLSP